MYLYVHENTRNSYQAWESGQSACRALCYASLWAMALKGSLRALCVLLASRSYSRAHRSLSRSLSHTHIPPMLVHVACHNPLFPVNSRSANLSRAGLPSHSGPDSTDTTGSTGARAADGTGIVDKLSNGMTQLVPVNTLITLTTRYIVILRSLIICILMINLI